MPDAASQNQQPPMEPEKLDLRSMDIAEARRGELLRLFPEIRTEGGKLDFDRLRLALGEAVDVGRERYGMNWPGKADCFKTIQTPSMGTLRPCPEESVNWDTTENVIIEGDNLEVLKLLQKSYLGKIKMIYIDPPYNTGNDFIYPDNYSESLQTYLEYTGQVDMEGRKFGTNTDADGRFHSKWMNMMYPRLYMARNLLREDGVIFISIDDNEMANLLTVCNEIFGEESHIATLVWEKKRKASNLDSEVRSITEYVVAYRRERPVPLIAAEDVPEENKPYPFYNTGNRRAVLAFPGGCVKTSMPDGEYRSGDYEDRKTLVRLLDDVVVSNGIIIGAFRLEGEWRYSQRAIDDLFAGQEQIVIKGDKFKPYWINNREREKYLKTLLNKDNYGVGTNEDGNQEIAALFGDDVFPFPKPVSLPRKLIEVIRDPEALILDFVAGSGTTAHAVLEMNMKDGGNRKFILVQLPEPIDPETAAGKAGFKTIADICKERVRRVIKKHDAEDEGQLDLNSDRAKSNCGFRVYKLAESNFTEWDARVEHEPQALERQLDLHVEHIREGRTEDDLLYEILLKSGFPLTTPIETLTLAGKKVYSVAGGALMLCLERSLTLEAIRAIADKKPERVVCLDAGFAGNDQLKTNAVQTFKTKGIGSFKTV